MDADPTPGGPEATRSARGAGPRVIVAEPPEVAPGAKGIAVPVGLQRGKHDRRWTLIVKATFAMPAQEGAEPALALAQDPLRGGDDSDFGRPRGATQVVVVGGDAPVSRRIRDLPAEGVLALPTGAIRLPRLAPRVVVEGFEGEARVVEVACDRLAIDLERRVFVLLYRGRVEMGGEGLVGVRRVVVSLEATPPRDPAEIRRALVRGTFAFAVEEADLPAPPGDADRLALARYELWTELLVEGHTDPSLSLDEYARVTAALAEGVEPRASTLGRLGLSEERWSIEEQGWLLRMAHDATESGGALAVAFGERFVIEQDLLARPEEAEVSVDDYAAIRDAVEQAEDPTAALRPWAMTLPMWMRLERRMMRAGLADPTVAAEIRAKLAALRAERKGAS